MPIANESKSFILFIKKKSMQANDVNKIQIGKMNFFINPGRRTK